MCALLLLLYDAVDFTVKYILKNFTHFGAAACIFIRVHIYIKFSFISLLNMTPSPLKKNSNVTQMVVGNEFRQTITQPPSTLPLPDAREMDWTSLVDTATKAISVTSGDDNSTTIEDLEDEEIEIAAAPKAKEILIQG